MIAGQGLPRFWLPAALDLYAHPHGQDDMGMFFLGAS